jgi:hypothetical protein
MFPMINIYKYIYIICVCSVNIYIYTWNRLDLCFEPKYIDTGMLMMVFFRETQNTPLC